MLEQPIVSDKSENLPCCIQTLLSWYSVSTGKLNFVAPDRRLIDLQGDSLIFYSQFMSLWIT